jgi:hypothetical protein
MDGVGGDRKAGRTGAVLWRSSRLHSFGPRCSGGGHVTQSRLLHRRQDLSVQVGMSCRIWWTTLSAPSPATSITRTGSCARSDTSFAAALAVCSEADSKSVFGLSQRALNFGIGSRWGAFMILLLQTNWTSAALADIVEAAIARFDQGGGQFAVQSTNMVTADRAQLCQSTARPGQSRLRSVGGRVHTRHPAGFAESRPRQYHLSMSCTQARLKRRARDRIPREKLALRVSTCRAGISIQAGMRADGLDGRHQIHEGFAATAMNSGRDHECRPSQTGELRSPSHRHLTELADDRAQLATETFVPFSP